MTEQELMEKITEVVTEKLGVEADKVTAEASFVDDLGADSLDRVELVMALEDEFDIEIPEEDAETLNKVSDAVEYVKTKI
ncbi:MAG: acyl carrier protein [Fibrobacter sp.]|nr:acyl carrier protein [Fibrobacter sp.]